jgi:acetolactate synthase regulatory subunit
MTMPQMVPSDDVGTSPAVYCFSVTAEPDPGTIGRVLAPIAKRGLIAQKLNAVIDSGVEDTLIIDLQASGLDQQSCDIVAAVMRQIVGVRSVLVCEKR